MKNSDFSKVNKKLLIFGQEKLREDYYQSVKKYVGNLSDISKLESENEVINVLGFPLNEKRKNPELLLKEKVLDNKDYILYKIQLKTFNNLLIYGLFAEPKNLKNRVPSVIVQHGGGDSPESVFGFNEKKVYKSIADYVAKFGVAVFAPQLLLWNKSEYGTSFERQKRLDFDAKLKQYGGSITALEISCIQSVIDYLISLEYIDDLRIGFLGMSYGGMYAIYSMAVDKRIKTGYSSSWFNDRNKYNWQDWIYRNGVYPDSQVVLSIFPRKLIIEVGKNDEMFDVESAQREFDNLINKNIDAKKYCWFNVFDGVHEISEDKRWVDNFIKELFN